MINKMMKMFALTEQGAKDLIKGCLGSTFQYFALMLPVGLVYYFVIDLMNNTLDGRIWLYVIGIIIAVILIILSTIIQYNTTFLATYIESGKRRTNLAEKLRKIPLSFFGKKDLSDLTSTIMADSATLETTFSHYIPTFVGAIIISFIACIALLIMNFKMGLAAIWVIPVSLLIVLLSFKKQDKINLKKTKARLDVEEGTQEFLETVKDLKTFNATSDYLSSLENKIDVLEKESFKNELGIAAFVVTAQMILKLGIATTAIMGSSLLIEGSIAIPVFFMYLLVVSRLYDPLQSALINLAAIISSNIPVRRMNEILFHKTQAGNQKLNINKYDIEFKNVEFSYNEDVHVIKNISFTAKQGEVTALVGPSGSGKTTISRLIPRFWDINSGHIFVGGTDISKINPESLMSAFSIVFQDVTLFNNTIMENIRIGRKNATDEEVVQAAKLANVDEFALKLENGYDTIIGENGKELSGGERQRISIARAFLKDAPIILLDEATASLDVDNETAIQTALSKLIKNKTVLIIAHRMRTISGADKIIVLDDGKIVETGKTEDLLKNDKIFAHMMKKQMTSQDWNL